MDSAQYEEVQQWLIKSQRDLRVAQVLLDNEESLLDHFVKDFYKIIGNDETIGAIALYAQ
ncbi:hypothetical protein IQ238_24730 [Pleurocapsales cyanobacterium LEGE 06147]|nr:hypothetical protein [Pleurocapsales cyanobacterium LEGE 06147]